MPAKAPAIAQLAELLDAEPPGVIGEINPRDGMYRYAPELYAVAGRSGLRCVQLAMLAAELTEPQRILDLPSGAGRVLRYLRAAFPDAEITACDIEQEWVEFCVQTFGAVGVVSDPDPSRIEVEGPFDLIWCGSLLTHVPRGTWLGFLDTMRSVLGVGGVLLFSVYGPNFAESLRAGGTWSDLTRKQVEQILRDYDAEGFGYQAVAGRHQGLGDTLVSPAWACATLAEQAPELDLLLYLQRAWLGHDIIACTKRK